MKPLPPNAEQRTADVPVAGGCLWTATQGTAGPPLVLCHGGPGLSDNLGPVADLVADDTIVHRYDQRGAPRSTANGPFTVARSVADLEALRRFWGHERWVVGGHSWGANLALLYALAHPSRTLGVIYLSGLGIEWGWQPETRRHRLSRLTPEERAELVGLERDVAARDAAANARLLRLMWTTDFASRAAADRALKAGPLYAYPRNDEAFQVANASHRDALAHNVAGRIAALTVPLLAVHGAGDADPSRSSRVADLAPHGEFVAIPDAGHSPWLERPQELGQVLRGFVPALGGEAQTNNA